MVRLILSIVSAGVLQRSVLSADSTFDCALQAVVEQLVREADCCGQRLELGLGLEPGLQARIHLSL